jgi:hypothetical protein
VPDINLPDNPIPHVASGAFITGPRGAGDIVPLWTKPGEVVLNQRQQAMIGSSRIAAVMRATGAQTVGPGGRAASGGVVAANAARKAGFKGQSLITALAVADAESGFNPRAQNLKYPDHSIGLWQINQLAHHGRYGSDAALMDPLTNARAAYAISGGGRSWGAWSTFTNGAYRGFLGVATQLAGTNGGMRAPGGTSKRLAAKGGKATGKILGPGGVIGGKLPTGKARTPSNFEDFYQAALAIAQMTPGTADDLAVLKAWRQYETGALATAKATGNAQGIISSAGTLGDINQQISAIENPTPESDPNQPLIDSNNALAAANAAQAEQERALAAEPKRQNDFATAVTTVSLGQAWKALADVVSGQIVGTGLNSRANTASAGSVVRY